jgi:ATP-dependent Lon protease
VRKRKPGSFANGSRKAILPDDVRKEAERELKRMEQLPQTAPDYHVIRTYLEYVLELPWRKSSPEKLDLNEARKVSTKTITDSKTSRNAFLNHLQL